MDLSFLESGIELPQTIAEYESLERKMKSGMTHRELMNLFWVLARADLFFLMRHILSTKEYFKGVELEEQWVLDRCRDVQARSNKIVDIWARFHWKSNIKTFANIIRKILIDPDTTILILSHTRPNAKKFLSQIQREIVSNELLRLLSWDPRLDGQIFHDNPKDYVRNSIDEGVIVNRIGNPKEGTVEGAGLVDSLPQGPHYKIRAIDDAVTPASVTTPEMKQKTVAMWELSQPLGMPSGDDEEWITGTFYAYDDAHHTMIQRGYELRLHPCFEIDHERTKHDSTGKITKLAHHLDKPVLYSAERLQELIRDMGAEEGSKNAAMQMFCDPSAGTMSGFEEEWLNYYDKNPESEGVGKNKYILVDPATEKKERLNKSTYTAMWVIGLGADGNYYALDMIRDRLSLSERTQALFRLHRKWKPIEVRYEKYGAMADIEHIQHVQAEEGYRFKMEEVGGPTPKKDRINWMEPVFRGGKFFLPRERWYRTVGGESVDLVKAFVDEEYKPFPNSSFMDMLDALARIREPGLRLVWPKEEGFHEVAYNRRRKRKTRRASGWMAA